MVSLPVGEGIVEPVTEALIEPETEELITTELTPDDWAAKHTAVRSDAYLLIISGHDPIMHVATSLTNFPLSIVQ